VNRNSHISINYTIICFARRSSSARTSLSDLTINRTAQFSKLVLIVKLCKPFVPHTSNRNISVIFTMFSVIAKFCNACFAICLRSEIQKKLFLYRVNHTTFLHLKSSTRTSQPSRYICREIRARHRIPHKFALKEARHCFIRRSTCASDALFKSDQKMKRGGGGTI